MMRITKSDRNKRIFYNSYILLFCLLGKKNNNSLLPDYVPPLFKYTTSPDRRRLKNKLVKFEQSQAMKKKRIEQQSRVDAAYALLQLYWQSDKILKLWKCCTGLLNCQLLEVLLSTSRLILVK